MFLLTNRAVLICDHGGTVGLDPHQTWVTIEDVPMLVKADSLHRPIGACPMATPTTTPCTLTVSVEEEASYSSLLSVDGRLVCKETATGRTNWSQLASVSYSVKTAGQNLVEVDG